jgi:predicted amidophosphoribosyltransferase
MVAVLDAWLDLVHGSRCVGCSTPGRLLCRGCAAVLPRSGVPVRPTPCPDGLAPCWAAGEYADLLRALVLAHKERRAFALARPLGQVLAGVVHGIPGPGGAGGRTLELLVPVPSRPDVVRERGHDPMLRIARAAASELRRLGRPVRVARLLRQRVPAGDQSGLGHAERAANLHDSLAVPAGPLRATARLGRAVVAVVCDDVLTTGATAREAQRALEDVGVPVAAVGCVAATRKRNARSGPSSLPFSAQAD